MCVLVPAHATCSICFINPNDIWWMIQIMKLLTVQFYPSSFSFLPLYFLIQQFTDLNNISVKLNVSYITVCCKTDVILSGKNSLGILQFSVLQDIGQLIILSSLIIGDTLAFHLLIYTALVDTTFLKHLSSTTMRSSFPLTLPPRTHDYVWLPCFHFEGCVLSQRKLKNKVPLFGLQFNSYCYST